MKKKCFVYIFLLVIMLGSCANKYDVIYKPGRDTHKLFGDGTYQLMSSAIYGDEGNLIEKRYQLFNCQYKIPILFNVSDYKKNDEVVCFKGIDESFNRIFITLDMKSNIIKYYNVDGGEPKFSCVNNLLDEGKLLLIKDVNELSDTESACYYELNWNS